MLVINIVKHHRELLCITVLHVVKLILIYTCLLQPLFVEYQSTIRPNYSQ